MQGTHALTNFDGFVLGMGAAEGSSSVVSSYFYLAIAQARVMFVLSMPYLRRLV